MADSVKVVIVGAGIIGNVIAYYLGRRGFTDCVVLERANAPCTGATPYSAGGIRAQFSTEANIRLCKLSIEQYEKYAEEVSPRFAFHQVGYLMVYVTPEEWAAAQANVKLQRSCGLDVKLWTPAEIAAYVPGVFVDDLAGGTFHQRDGLAEPYEITMGYYEGAKAFGIPVSLEEEVLEVLVDHATNRVRGVRTNKREIACEMVVDCCGPWAREFAERGGLEVPVNPYRRQLFMTKPFDAVRDDFPMLVDLHTGGYLRPETGGLMMGWADTAEASSFNTTFDWDWMMQTMEICSQRFPPVAEAEFLRGWAHLYDITPDHHPILGAHPLVGNFLAQVGAFA
ncbi:MAG: FAD-binding oxidoreductase [bacterium]